MKKLLALVLASVICLSCFAFAGCSKADENVIKIGVFEPASGQNAAGGKQEILGMKYANTLKPTVTIDGTEYKAVANIGVRPTVTNHAENVNCETHIIGFSGDLYGRTISVRLCGFLRDEKKFSSVDELKSAILADEENALRLLSGGG